MSIRKHTAKNGTTSYGVRINRGAGGMEWVGTYPTAQAGQGSPSASALAHGPACASSLTCADWAARFLARYSRERKDSSVRHRPLRAQALHSPTSATGRSTRSPASRRSTGPSASRPRRMPVVITLMNAALDAELIDRNPFRGLQRATRGRSDDAPPTTEELDRIVQACAVHGAYAAQMRALVLFAAYTRHAARRAVRARAGRRRPRRDAHRRAPPALPRPRRPAEVEQAAPDRAHPAGARGARAAAAPGRARVPAPSRAGGSRSRRSRATGASCSPPPGSSSTSTSRRSTGPCTTCTSSSGCRRG